MLTSVLLSLSVAVALLSILDFCLSATQKKRVEDFVVKVWNILDEAKGWSFSDWLKNPRASWWFAISFALLLAAYQLWMMNYIWALQRRAHINEFANDSPYKLWFISLFVAAIAFAFFTFVARPIFAWLLKFNKPLVYVFLAAGAAYALAFFTLVHYDKSDTFQGVALSFYIIIGFPSGLLLLVTLFIGFARSLAYAATVILFVGEFLVRRIAEYRKGPIIALSVLFGIVVALIKAFTE
jgi:hypothetical protein